MLKSYFSFSTKSQQNNKIILNKNILKKINYIIYSIINLIYSLLILWLYPFQRAFINLYTVQLQLDRLPFRTLPTTIKIILIYFVDIESWILFFKRIKNHINLYLIREKHYLYLHKIWCVFFRNKSIYYSELNIKRVKSNKISNFFYKTRFWNKHTKKVSPKKYKFVFFYYINKLVFNNYPYFYWTYILTYNKYNYNIKATQYSEHIRTQIFFFFVNEFNIFIQIKKPRSFAKFNFYTFKGIKKTTININKLKSYKFISRTKQTKDKIITKLEDQLRLFDKNFIKIYSSIHKLKEPTYKFYLHSIIFSNYTAIKNLTNIFLINTTKIFVIHWYNKIHNSTTNSFKNNIILFLRSAKHFNKGRYSRNRQLYRTGVYWCIWLNVVIVYSLHFYFYRVVYSFGYLWLPLMFMLISIFISRIYKYRYYNINYLITEFKEFSNLWFYIFIKIKYVVINTIKTKLNLFINYIIIYILLLYNFIISKILLIYRFFKKIITS